MCIYIDVDVDIDIDINESVATPFLVGSNRRPLLEELRIELVSDYMSVSLLPSLLSWLLKFRAR